MQSQQFKTHGFAASDQFDAWLGWFDRVFDVTPVQPREQGFKASMQAWTLGGGTLSRVAAPSLNVTRTRTLINRNPIDPWVITIGQATTTKVQAGQRVFKVPPRVPFIVSLGQELVSERDEDARLQLYLSRDDYATVAPALDAACGSVVTGAMGALLADYMMVLERHLSAVAEADLPRLKDAISAMVVACVAPSADRMAEAEQQIDLGRLERVRRAVRKHLRSPSLGPALLCRYVGTSRSQLYRLLEPEGGVACYIRRQRLLAAYAMLADPNNNTTITQIADELCFADGSGFSRAFRQEFDISPTELRIASRTGRRLVSQPEDVAGRPLASLDQLLRAA
ncbi:MAG: helix-turn-helix domain-containing protein [Proteobacteria bacterium]|nr:helix-turn-helix domain-containing protein [Pseudomonadota bacterium]